MHISDGVLNSDILIVGDVLAAGVLLYSFKTLKQDKIILCAVMAALFFMASFVHIPIGPTSTHLLMSGIVGVFLGSGAFVAIFVGLFLQALLFGYGGLSVLGVNLLIMATPTLLAYYLFKIKFKSPIKQAIVYFFMGALPVCVSAVLLSLTLAINGEEFLSVAYLSFLSNIPVMLIEGIFMIFIIRYISKVAPHLLEK